MTNPSKSLHQAAATGDIALITSLIAQGEDINAWDAWGHQKTPLIYAIEAKQSDAVKTLISLGADVNVVGHDGLNHFHSPIYFACAQTVDLIEAGLINANGTLGDKSPIDYRITGESNDSYLKIAYELMNAGAKPDDLSSKSLTQVLAYSAAEGNLPVVQSLVQDYHADILKTVEFSVPNAIIAAASAGKVDVLDYLLSKPHLKFDTNYKSILTDALTSAVANDNTQLDVAKLLIDAGADVNGTSKYSYPLKYAIYNFDEPNFEMAKLLLDNGANIEPLQESIKYAILNHLVLDNYVEHIKEIYNFINEHSEFTIDVNIDNNKWGGSSYGVTSTDASIYVETAKGDSPLHTAVQSNCFKGVQFLLELGANPTLKNAQGESVLDYAMKYATDDVKVAITESYDTFKSEVAVDTGADSSYLDMFYNLFSTNNKSKAVDIKISDVLDTTANQALDINFDNAMPAQAALIAQPAVMTQQDVLPAVVMYHQEIL